MNAHDTETPGVNDNDNAEIVTDEVAEPDVASELDSETADVMDESDEGAVQDDAEENAEEGEGETVAETPPPSEAEIHDAKRLVEAILFASADTLSERAIAGRVPDGINVKALLKDLQEEYAGRGVNLVRVGISWAFRTAHDLSAKLNIETEVSRKLGRATIETMAIIAYHQPVTRAEIEEIRGVSLSKGTLDVLFEKSWIKPRGRRETPGRPMTWGTTDDFLDHFGLSRVTDLPGMDELKAAGLLESGPALNVYRSRGDIGEGNGAQTADGEEVTDENNADPAAQVPFSSQGEEDALPETADEGDVAEPLDPDAT